MNDFKGTQLLSVWLHYSGGGGGGRLLQVLIKCTETEHAAPSPTPHPGKILKHKWYKISKCYTLACRSLVVSQNAFIGGAGVPLL